MQEKKQIENNKEYEKKRTPNKKTKKVIAAILATVGGVSAVTVASVVIAYEVIFARYERPDYSLYPGEYCFSRVKDRLEREEFYFNAGETQLKGYYYPVENAKGLVVIVHGFHAGADDFIPVAEFMVNNGYNVFCYDGTGVYDSKGDSSVGMCQSLVDLDNVLNYIKGNAKFQGQKVFLIGHSWGGYAAASVLAIHKDVSACAVIAPMNSGYTIMVEKGTQYAGKIAYFSKPIFDAYQWILFGNYTNYNGVKGINSCDIPVLVAQGIDDDTITYDKQSIMAYRKEITNPNVIYYETKGILGGHNSILHSVESNLYQQEVASDLKRMQYLKGSSLTDSEKADYYKTVDHKLYSAVNQQLFTKILEMFNSVV